MAVLAVRERQGRRFRAKRRRHAKCVLTLAAISGNLVSVSYTNFPALPGVKGPPRCGLLLFLGSVPWRRIIRRLTGQVALFGESRRALPHDCTRQDVTH
jgi:hypothetical protein